MTQPYTENLPEDDPRQKLFALRAKVLDGEEITDEEYRQAIDLLREHRSGKSSPTSRKPATADSQPAAGKGKAAPTFDDV